MSGIVAHFHISLTYHCFSVAKFWQWRDSSSVRAMWGLMMAAHSLSLSERGRVMTAEGEGSRCVGANSAGVMKDMEGLGAAG